MNILSRCHSLRRPLCALLLAGAAMSALSQEVETVAAVDLTRYTGKWYEIARFPNSFQNKCIGNVTAQYHARADGKIDVVNRCKVEGGTFDEEDGLARIVPDSGNARLEVRFAPAWLSWISLVWGDYWIIDLDADYTVATVGTPARDYLWILSRTPTLSAAQYEAAVNHATRQGFDTAKLVKTAQD